MKIGKGILIGIFFMILEIFIIFGVNAAVYFSQLEKAYNLEDTINVNVSISPLENKPIRIDLVCEGKRKLMAYYPLPEELFTLKLPLTAAHIENLTGNCYFEAEYAGEIFKSSDFQISKKLNVNLDTLDLFAKPKESVTISGSASRVSGVGINGVVEISIPFLEMENKTEISKTTFGGKVEEGVFSVNFQLPQDMPAGKYRVDVLVYELNPENERTSEGTAIATLHVSQVLTEIGVAINNQNFDPGENIEIKPLLMDQSGVPIEGKASLIIRNEKKERIFEKIIESGKTFVYPIPTNLSSGYYEIEVSAGNLNISKRFFVNEKAIASFKLKNNTLIVTNIGNIPYKKDIQIELDGKPFVRKVNLRIGESTKFKLLGNNKKYDIKISDGENQEEFLGIPLTGYAVGVKKIRENKGSIFKLPVFWISILVILGIVVLYLFRKRIFEKKAVTYPREYKGKIKLDKDGRIIRIKKSEEKKFSKEKTPTSAEKVLVLKGHKNNVAFLVLKIKNEIKEIGKRNLKKALEEVFKEKGVVYEKEREVTVIFSPLITKTFKNELKALKSALRIKKFLDEVNEKFMEKIDYGIGIHEGEVINQIENGKLKFTALGNVLIRAKKLADISNREILISEEVYRKAVNDIVAKRIDKKGEGKVAYSVNEVKDREKSEKFIRSFLERMKKEERGG